MKYDHTYELLTNGIASMVVNKDNIQNRILAAYDNYIFLIDLEKMPKEIEPQFLELEEKIQKNKPINKISDEKALEIANDIFTLYSKFLHYYYKP